MPNDEPEEPAVGKKKTHLIKVSRSVWTSAAVRQDFTLGRKLPAGFPGKLLPKFPRSAKGSKV